MEKKEGGEFMADYAKIGRELRKLRSVRGLSMKDVGDQMGVTKMCIHYWETGKRRIDIYSLRDYCIIVGDSIENFLNRVGIDKADLEEHESEDADEWTMLINYPNGTQAFISSNDIELLTDYLSNLERR